MHLERNSPAGEGEELLGKEEMGARIPEAKLSLNTIAHWRFEPVTAEKQALK